MFNFSNPAWWSTWIISILGVFGVTDPTIQGDVKMVISGGVAIIIAVYTWEHHKTIRNADNAAVSIKQVAAQKEITLAQIAAATPAQAPPPPLDVTQGDVAAGSVAAGVQTGAKQYLPLPSGLPDEPTL